MPLGGCPSIEKFPLDQIFSPPVAMKFQAPTCPHSPAHTCSIQRRLQPPSKSSLPVRCLSSASGQTAWLDGAHVLLGGHAAGDALYYLPYQKRESHCASIPHCQEGNSLGRLPVSRWERNTRSIELPTRGWGAQVAWSARGRRTRTAPPWPSVHRGVPPWVASP